MLQLPVVSPLIDMIADRVEGNLLAAGQEIEKLRLLHGEGKVTADDVGNAVADSSRFDVFKLVDAALQGDAARALRILGGLQAEPIEPAGDPPGSFPFEVSVRALQERGPVAVVRPAEGVFTMRVGTPAGVVRQSAEDPLHGIALTGEALQQYRGLLAPLPADVVVWVAVEERGFAGASDWFEVALGES